MLCRTEHTCIWGGGGVGRDSSPYRLDSCRLSACSIVRIVSPPCTLDGRALPPKFTGLPDNNLMCMTCSRGLGEGTKNIISIKFQFPLRVFGIPPKEKHGNVFGECNVLWRLPNLCLWTLFASTVVRKCIYSLVLYELENMGYWEFVAFVVAAARMCRISTLDG